MLSADSTSSANAMQSDGIDALPGLKIWGKRFVAMIEDAATDCEAVDATLAQEVRALAIRFDEILEADMSRIILRIRHLLIARHQGGAA